MKLLKVLATLMSLGIAGIGILGMASPSVLLDFIPSVLAPPALYGVAAVRVFFGVMLILVAAASRMPRILRLIGILIVVAGLLTPFFGTGAIREIIAWFSGPGLSLFRTAAVVPVLVGLFFVYAINPRR